LPQNRQDPYKTTAHAAESDHAYRTVLLGYDAEGFLGLLRESQANNPTKKAYLEEAVAFSERLLKTGRLPD
jgi:hypothetical protein